MARVMLLLPKTTYRAEAFIRGAVRSGIGVTVASDVCHLLDAKWGLGDVCEVDFDAPEEATARIVAKCTTHPVDALVPVTEASALVAALAAERLGLAYNAANAAYAARNKRALREALSSAEVAQPDYAVASLDDDPREVAMRARTLFPCVVKPVLLSSSRGVIRADDEGALADAMTRIDAIVRLPELFKVHDADRRTILIERFIEGPEVALEGVLTRGRLQTLALFDKPDPLDGPYFEETIYVTPSRLEASVQERIRETTEAAARAMGLTTGPVHAELRIRNGGEPVVIEVAARSIGGLCARTLRFAGDMSLEELIVRHAVGEDVAETALIGGASGVMMLPVDRGGILDAVHGVEDARGVQGIEDVVIGAPIGTKLVPLPEGGSYLGFLFARGGSPQAVEAALRDAYRCLAFDVSRALT